MDCPAPPKERRASKPDNDILGVYLQISK